MSEILATQDDEAPVVEEQPDMDETIRATLAEIQSREAQPEEVESEEVKAERQRDEKGRFAPKTEGEATQEAPAEAETPEIQAQDTLPPEVQRLGLRKEEVEEWKKASPVLQNVLLRRSEEMHKGLEQYRAPAQFGQAMYEAIRPYENTLRQLNVAPDVAISKLFEADNILRNGTPQAKAAAIHHLIQSYGIDMGQAQQPTQVDPQVYALQNQIQQLQGFVNNFQRSQAEQEQAMLNSEIARFAQGKEHFDAVREDMAALLQAGRAQTLDDAYQMAIWANPQVRAAMLAKQQQEQDATRKAEADLKAKEARKASSVNIPRRGTMAATSPKGTMEDTIRAEAARLGLISN